MLAETVQEFGSVGVESPLPSINTLVAYYNASCALVLANRRDPPQEEAHLSHVLLIRG